ncbi:MAG: AAA family ATPase [Candidatus Moranbacteria bacterium]|nr:AAA family ATPase [Candidatus Moranbacteria bacterium]
MYLKRIEITGFKSFATKTILDFLPSCDVMEIGSPRGDAISKNSCGITAIVGPNGSGKSNVADAIKWAMGEQSLKNLRGKKSEDVIFAGSGKKAQLGSAKVSLFFDNSDKKIPIEFEEVVIARKIYRSGEGEYLINGSKVRLIDIHDILAKAGVGQRSYCIINQGMADAVLNASPVERRVILEEAAGVKPYQLKKERSLRKLDTTRANMLRAADLVREIEPHLRVLKRQADKARKGEEVVQELKEKQKILFGSLWRDISSKKENVSAEKEETGREEMKMQRKIDDLEIRVKQETKTNVNFESQRNFLEKEREEKFSVLNEIRKNLAMVEAKIEIEKEKAKNFARISEIPVDFPYFKEEFKKLRDVYEKLENKLAEIEKLEELEAIKSELGMLKKEFNRISRELDEGKKEQAEVKQKESVINLKIIGDLETERKLFVDKQELLGREIEENRKKTDQLFRDDRSARRRYFELEAELRRMQEGLSGIREKLNEIKIRMARIEVREEDLRARIKMEMNIENPEQFLEEKPAEEASDLEKLEREVARLKVLAEQIGAIDPLIVEEYDETQKRYDFLTGQSLDLEKAMASLAEIIKEMDEKIKISFEETFKRVNAEFSKYFKIIFGGGSAEMMKVKIEPRKSAKDIDEDIIEKDKIEDEEDSEGSRLIGNPPERRETGIEIKACPQGKKISNLAILSGGERSLTSLALLFAIISNSPPPFAVLDEVEAALDEANSKRFGRIIHELSNQTQFVLITHNRETMRQASYLYGVTMGADGVSKVLSVKLDQVGEKGEIR